MKKNNKLMKKLLLLIAIILPTLLFSQNVGIGTNTPGSKLSVNGNVAIGQNYSILTTNLPTNGLIVEGNAGIGNTSPDHKLTVVGNLRVSRDNTAQCCSGADEYTLAIAENSATTGRASSISFHNSMESEAFMRLLGGGSGPRAGQRRFFFGDNQNSATTLQVQGLAGTGNRVVIADANGILGVNPNIGTAPITDCNTGGTYQVTITIKFGFYCGENTWQLRSSPTWGVGVILSGGPGSPNNTTNCGYLFTQTITLNYGQTYYLEGRDSWGDGWNGDAWMNVGVPFNTGNMAVAGSGLLYTFRLCQTSIKNQRMLRGNVASNSFVDSGGGFSTTKLGTGLYRIDFTNPFSEIPSVAAIQLGSGNTRDNVLAYDLSTTGVTFKTGDGNGNVSDRPFSFIIMGTE
jgi:hypothetical protein